MTSKHPFQTKLFYDTVLGSSIPIRKELCKYDGDYML